MQTHVQKNESITLIAVVRCMECGKDMDAAIAASALGRFLFCRTDSFLLSYPDLKPIAIPITVTIPEDTWFAISPPRNGPLSIPVQVPCYSTSIADAEVALKEFSAMRTGCQWSSVRRNDKGIWTIELQASLEKLVNWWTGVGYTEPEALCRAILRASGCALSANEVEKTTFVEHVKGDVL